MSGPALSVSTSGCRHLKPMVVEVKGRNWGYVGSAHEMESVCLCGGEQWEPKNREKDRAKELRLEVH